MIGGVDRRRGRIAAAIFVLQTIGSGVAVYALPIYLAVFLTSGLAEPATLSAAGTAFFLASACSGMIFGLVDRRGAVPALAVAATGGALAIAGLALHSAQVFVVVAFAALGAFFNGYVIVGTTLLVHVFGGRPSSGMALATSGSSAGGVIISPLLALLISDSDGLTRGMLLLAMGALAASGVAIAVLAVLLSDVDRSPRPGQSSGEKSVAVGATREPVRNRVEAEPERQPTLAAQWPLVVGFCLVTASQLGATSYSVSLAASRGFAGASLAVMITTGAAVGSRWLGGVGIRRWGVQGWAMISFAGQAAGVALIGLSPTTWVLFAGCVLIGQSLGNTLLLRSQVVVDIFGRRDFARRFGQFMTCTSLGSAAGPFVLGQVLALTQSYATAYLAGFALNLIAIPFLVPWLRSGRSLRPPTAPRTASRASCSPSNP